MALDERYFGFEPKEGDYVLYTYEQKPVGIETREKTILTFIIPKVLWYRGKKFKNLTDIDVTLNLEEAINIAKKKSNNKELSISESKLIITQDKNETFKFYYFIHLISDDKSHNACYIVLPDKKVVIPIVQFMPINN